MAFGGKSKHRSAREAVEEAEHGGEASAPVESSDGGDSSENSSSSSSWASTPPPQNLTADSVYDFYARNLLPAIWASLPLLLSRVGQDVFSYVRLGFEKVVRFLLPWYDERLSSEWAAPNFATLWNQTWAATAGGGPDSQGGNVASENALVQFMLRHFDTNRDGHISASELLHMENYRLPSLPQYVPPHPQTWLSWLPTAWNPMMDWKFGVFLWRSCSGLLLVIAIASVVPGRMHGYSGRLLRWPILVLTYVMIFVELVVYVIIRVVIKVAEGIFANPKHRMLRRKMARATTYGEWYDIAKELDESQGRDKWQRVVDDDTSYRYNWAFIQELMSDMRIARRKNDSLMALAVLQQCTRKNVGGIMSEDMFSYTNTGEPKYVVREFVEEVVTTLRWVTEQARKIPVEPAGTDESNGAVEGKDLTSKRGSVVKDAAYEAKLQRKVKEEKKKIYGSLIEWATLSFLSPGSVPLKGEAHRSVARSSSQPTTQTMQRSSSSDAENDNVGRPMTISSSAESLSAAPVPLPALHREKVKTFLKRARAAYGRTALCLSGGAMMGNYHFGHMRALLECGALPHIISGTSAGSVVAALVCTRTDEEIRRDMRPEVLVDRLKCFSRSWPDRIKSVYQTGNLFDHEEWLELIQWFTCGDLTFEEAYRKTGRVFCVTLSATTKKAPPVLLNYITAPNVTIFSAVIASAAVPGFIQPLLLRIKDSDGVVRNQGENKDQTYWDGSIEQDIPTSGLAEMLNCQFFVAAQCNPHIVPFFYNSKGDVGRPSRWSSGMREDSWRGGFLLSALELYLKSDMRAKFCFLNDLEAAIGFTSTLMTQPTYGGTTTIVPRVVVQDFFKLFANPTLSDLYRYFQGGSVAAYQHCAMIKLHYHTAHALDECLASLEQDEVGCPAIEKPRRRRSQLLAVQALDGNSRKRLGSGADMAYVLTSSVFNTDGNAVNPANGLGSRTESDSSSVSGDDDEYEQGGFDGVECAFTNRRVSTMRH